MNIVIWILQVLLAALFLLHGWLFLAPSPEMIEFMEAHFTPWFRIFLGIAEWLAAAGLILPSLTRILPWLTPLAAAGLMVVTISATGLHLLRGEIGGSLITAVLFMVITFVAYMRWKVKPIPPRAIALNISIPPAKI